MSNQCLGVPGAQKTHTLAILGPPQDGGTHAQRHEQQAPQPLGFLRPAMLVEVPQLAAKILDVQPAPVRCAPDMHDLGAGVEPHLPAGTAEARQPVGLLAEQEEALVEQPDRVGRLPAHQQGGSREPVDLAGACVVETAGVERVEQVGARRELADEQVLGRDPPEGRAPRAPSAAACRRC